jgi:hypothetical protein
MKQLKLTQEQKDIIKFPLENISPTDNKSIVLIKDLRQIDKICKVLESPSDTIELEDADFVYMKNKFTSYNGWNPSGDIRSSLIAIADILEAVK